MFERVVSFLKDLPNAIAHPAGHERRHDDPRIAAAALLYHVMDADGVRLDVEWERMKDGLKAIFHVEGRELDALVEAGEEADHEAIDLYAFTSVLLRHLDEDGRVAFIRLMWDVVYADGVVHELEDSTIWRVADLIGVENRDRVLARRAAARNAGRADVTDEVKG